MCTTCTVLSSTMENKEVQALDPVTGVWCPGTTMEDSKIRFHGFTKKLADAVVRIEDVRIPLPERLKERNKCNTLELSRLLRDDKAVWRKEGREITVFINDRFKGEIESTGGDTIPYEDLSPVSLKISTLKGPCTSTKRKAEKTKTIKTTNVVKKKATMLASKSAEPVAELTVTEDEINAMVGNISPLKLKLTDPQMAKVKQKVNNWKDANTSASTVVELKKINSELVKMNSTLLDLKCIFASNFDLQSSDNEGSSSSSAVNGLAFQTSPGKSRVFDYIPLVPRALHYFNAPSPKNAVSPSAHKTLMSLTMPTDHAVFASARSPKNAVSPSAHKTLVSLTMPTDHAVSPSAHKTLVSPTMSTDHAVSPSAHKTLVSPTMSTDHAVFASARSPKNAVSPSAHTTLVSLTMPTDHAVSPSAHKTLVSPTMSTDHAVFASARSPKNAVSPSAHKTLMSLTMPTDHAVFASARSPKNAVSPSAHKTLVSLTMPTDHAVSPSAHKTLVSPTMSTDHAVSPSAHKTFVSPTMSTDHAVFASARSPKNAVSPSAHTTLVSLTMPTDHAVSPSAHKTLVSPTMSTDHAVFASARSPKNAVSPSAHKTLVSLTMPTDHAVSPSAQSPQNAESPSAHKTLVSLTMPTDHAVSPSAHTTRVSPTMSTDHAVSPSAHTTRVSPTMSTDHAVFTSAQSPQNDMFASAYTMSPTTSVTSVCQSNGYNVGFDCDQSLLEVIHETNNMLNDISQELSDSEIVKSLESIADSEENEPVPVNPAGCEFLNSTLINDLAVKSKRSRNAFASRLTTCLFTIEEITGRNVNGLQGKKQLNEVKINYIRYLVFLYFPVACPVRQKTWQFECVKAIDRTNRQRLLLFKKAHI